MATFIEIYLLPARNGDCLLLQYSTGVRLLVDTGYKSTYTEYLKPRLLQWARQGRTLDYCIITHIDADHIEGAYKGLFPENQAAGSPQVIYINQVWHNGYRHLRPSNGQTIPNTRTDEAILRSLVNRQPVGEMSAADTGPRLLNAKQGTSLSAQLVKYGYAWNTSVNEGPLVVPFAAQLAPGLSCRLVSPTVAGLAKLASRWETELAKMGVRERQESSPLMEQAYEFWLQTERWLPSTGPRPIAAVAPASPQAYLRAAFTEDKSPINGSSLAFVLEMQELRLLLLGDAHPSVVLAELSRAYGGHQDKPWWFAAIKLSHHGSFSNNSPTLLQATDSDCYLISTDGGRHHHPDLATLAWIVTRPLTRPGQIRKLCCNYLTPSIAQFNRIDWQQTYHYTITVLDPDQPLILTA